ncbi:unnamed protein product [Brassicogethes aeneus]|uniref:Uncharacterized protein n=1 Tax=Brassicogethes aeneus TaxID=1431903 RepID=A0A9P0AYF0_BRAAE|nr:unnamed protein product [Brassicogethes aeneus]
MCKMNTSLLWTSFLILVLSQFEESSASTLTRVARETKYTTRFDNIDVDAVLKSSRLLLSYVKCLLDKGPCTVEGKELKKFIPDALNSECSKCSEIQKKQAGKVFTNLLLHHRDYWNQLIDKYDPNGIYKTKYEVDNEDYDYSQLDDA